MSEYKVEITQYSNGEKPRTAVAERYTEIVEAESGEQAVERVKAEGSSNYDVDIELLGEADPSEPVTWTQTMSKYVVEVLSWIEHQNEQIEIGMVNEVVEAKDGDAAADLIVRLYDELDKHQAEYSNGCLVNRTMRTLGEADPSEPVTFFDDWAEREYEEHNPGHLFNEGEDSNE